MIKTKFLGEGWDSHIAEATAIFLAGPTLRDRRCRYTETHAKVGCTWCKRDPDFRERSWRQDVVDRLAVPPHEDVTLFIPEFRDWRSWEEADEKKRRRYVEWRLRAMSYCLTVMFWIPREMGRLSGLTTNIDFGYMLAQHPRRIVLGAPPNAPDIEELRARLNHWRGEEAPCYFTLEETINAALHRTYGGFR